MDNDALRATLRIILGPAPHGAAPAPMDDAADITTLINQAGAGDAASRERLLALIYHDLLRLARSKLARERTYTDLNAGSLVHEAYLRFADNIPQDVASRRVFYAYAARAMESVIIDHVRQRGAKKRGEGVAEVTLPTGFEGEAPQTCSAEQFEALHSALGRLERIDAQLHEIVQLRYFGGLTVEQVADTLGRAPIWVKRRWKEAMVILKHELG